MHDHEIATRAETSWYVSRRMQIPHENAARALGEALRSDAIGPETSVAIAVDDVHHARPGAAQGFTGRLRLGRVFRATRVEVELVPWSRSESALGVRPAHRPPRQRADRYFAHAIALLEDLEACLVARTAAPEPAEMRRAS